MRGGGGTWSVAWAVARGGTRRGDGSGPWWRGDVAAGVVARVEGREEAPLGVAQRACMDTLSGTPSEAKEVRTLATLVA